MTKIEQYYNKFHEEHRLETRHGKVEFTVSLKYINECLEKIKSEAGKDNATIKIADIGAGTGRYSVELCHEGFDVTAVELVKHNLEILRAKHENIKTWQGNAMDLSFLEDETFDVTLLFGPLYHLHKKEDKLKALAEAKRITKPGGFILAAYVMNEYSVITYCFKEHKFTQVKEKGGLSDDYHIVCNEDELYDYVRLSDIDELNREAGLKREKIISADGPADFMRRELNEMTEEEFSGFLDFVLSICERPDLVGAGSHTVDILKR
jgi:ubiquinone/menaquinone biosynthesis C-methylase UbiE